jgi:hypothetical protein
MNFQGSGRPINDEGMDKVCSALGIAESAVWAVLTVETRGFGYLQDRRPQILFERHIFHRLTAGVHDTGNEAISNRIPGGYVGGRSEYDRLEKAMELAREAALQSASWGIGQVMGFNYEAAGFTSVDAMVEGMVKSENEQLMAMANFIKFNNLADALRRNNWVSFARGYNGRDFKKNEYDTRLAAACAKFLIILPDLTLRTTQAALRYLGIDPGPVDGLRGRRTRSAIIQFQERFGLQATGELDQDTEDKLNAEAFPGINT